MDRNYNNEPFDPLTLVCIVFFLILLLSLAFGCAAHSTYNPRQVPELNCGETKYNGNWHKFCCEQEHCVFID